jgi:hypothetical protein
LQDCSKLGFISGQLDTPKVLSIFNCPELRSLESLCIIDHSALEDLVLRCCKSLASLPGGPEPQVYSSLRRLRIRECPGIKSLPSALQQRLDSGLMDETGLDSRLEGTHQSFPYGACINLVFACLPSPFFFGGHATVHICPVISNLNAYNVLILTELADIYIWKSYYILTILWTYISLLCSPWLPGRLCLSAPRFLLGSFILWALLGPYVFH